ncbi:unnamed protein product [Rotaria socialis]|uniref:Uncharacterized protein n=3 Tax=Rotaria socialis TaxID=392032 RepID=A0A821K8T5_9BILA|nr:unnamed protein product [Rotaria socialis]CAF3454532.1 unnamed protein product [Rotaria socialis]CAF3501334.1 unnamed protein product [Rotaria socialis]CAF3728246.1 unnamed protein product [Rotaria socialis]CAF3764761.1 unnamed protein product [Rotaria socialis]
MAFQANRFYNPKDGTYANVPIIPIHTEKFRGKRQFGTDVLIGNWYEDRSKSQQSNFTHNSTYRRDFPVHVDCLPNTVLRRKLLLAQEERPGRMILGHHNIDDQKQLITSYDEHFNRRGPYGTDRFAPERKWALQDDCWLPEHSDHPLEGEPTRFGLMEKKRSQSQMLHRSLTVPETSEYADRYIPHESKLYAESTRVAIPRLFSTALDRTNAVNKDLNYRSITNSSRRQPTTRDAKEIDYLSSFQRNTSIPRTYYYLGKATDTVDDKMREKFPFLPAPINSLQQIKSSTIEKLPNQQEQSVYA